MIRVRSATLNDVKTLAVLLKGMDRFYGEDHETIEDKIANITTCLFGNAPCASALLAWDQSDLLGFASYSFLWPAIMSSKSLYLKELYVRQDRRRSGVGRSLMEHVCRIARESSCSRVEWTTDVDNSGARSFYEELGFQSVSTKLFYRVEVQA